MIAPMQLDVRSALILRHPTDSSVLLLRRSAEKRLFPSLITGIGGKVELDEGEGDDLTAALLREFAEETRIAPATVTDVRCRLSTLVTRGQLQVLLLWYTGRLTREPLDLACEEGELEFFPLQQLPTDTMIPTARRAIPFILSLPDSDETIYNGIFNADGDLMVNDG